MAVLLTAFGHVVVWFCAPHAISAVVFLITGGVHAQQWHLWGVKPTTDETILSVSVSFEWQMLVWNTIFLCARKGNLVINMLLKWLFVHLDCFCVCAFYYQSGEWNEGIRGILIRRLSELWCLLDIRSCSVEGEFDLLNNGAAKSGGESRCARTVPKGQRAAVAGPDVDSWTTRSHSRRQDLFNSENATRVPAAETATAQKSPGRYNANVVGGFDFFQPLQRSRSVWQPRRRSSPGVRSLALPLFHASPHLAGALGGKKPTASYLFTLNSAP